MAKILTMFFSYSFYATIIWTVLEPYSTWIGYAQNYLFLWQILMWFTFVLMALGILGICFYDEADWEKHKESTKDLVKATQSGIGKFHRVLSWGMILFVGITGINWSLFTVMLLVQVTMEIFRSIAVRETSK